MKRIFQVWLFLFVLMAFVVTLVVSYEIHSMLAENAAKDLLRVKLADAAQEIVHSRENLAVITELSDSAALAKARALAEIVKSDVEILNDTARLQALCKKLDVDEIHVSDERGVLIASIPENYRNYNMADSKQSAEFLPALKDKTFELVQKPQRNGIEKKMFQYVGVARQDKSGIVQIGYSPVRLENATELSDVKYISEVFRIGNTGSLKITPHEENGTLYGPLVPRNEHSYFALEEGIESLCMSVFYGNYRLIGSLPKEEMYVSRDSIIQILVFGNLILFGVIFILISRLLQKVVIKGIYSVNDSLSQIQEGNLNEQVEVLTTAEFAALSSGINSTVDALKRAIEAEAKRLDAELEIGRTIQTSVLPNEFPENERYRLFAAMHTAKEVGGDFFDFFMIDEDHLAVLIADVSGKGITAALYMMTAKTLLKELAQSGKSPEDVFTLANREIGKNNQAHMFLSAFLGVLDLRTGVMTCVNAGHNPPMLKHADGSWEYLRVKHSVVLGISKKARYTNVELNLSKGDRLLLYTDGVTEAMDPELKLYGEDALESFMNTQDGTPNEVLANLRAELKSFANGATQSDDITMLLVDYLP